MSNTERLVADITPEVKRGAKAAAALNGVNLNEYVEKALIAYAIEDKKAQPEDIEIN